MDIDLSVLRSLEAEKDISFELAIKAIEDALLVAYHKTEGAAAVARVEVNRGQTAVAFPMSGRRHGPVITEARISCGRRSVRRRIIALQRTNL